MAKDATYGKLDAAPDSLDPGIEEAGAFPEIELPFAFPMGARHSVACVGSDGGRSADRFGNAPDYAAAVLAIGRLLAPDGNTAALPPGLRWRRDALGKPFTEWTGALAEWARVQGLESRHLHVSNTHDGGAHIVIAAYSAELAGIGIDLVWLPRLRTPGKDRRYLLRFARQFMSAEELAAFESTLDDPFLLSHLAVHSPCPPLPGPEEALILRTAAHFSLMEAASKACGTGLKIGVGMGRHTSLPKQSLGALRLFPEVELAFGPEARQRLEEIGAARYEAFVSAGPEMLVSVVALYRPHPKPHSR